MKKQTWLIMLAGALTGLTALVLTANGNPANMGFCIACFCGTLREVWDCTVRQRCSTFALRLPVLCWALWVCLLSPRSFVPKLALPLHCAL